MVIGGLDHAIGSKPVKIAELVRKHATTAQPVDVTLVRDGDTVTITAMAERTVPTAVVQIITFIPKAEVSIKRGENAGRTITYHNVVQSMVNLGTWDGRSAYEATASVAADVPVAVLIQAENAGPILGANQLK